jgi:hypothetical protein
LNRMGHLMLLDASLSKPWKPQYISRIVVQQRLFKEKTPFEA